VAARGDGWLPQTPKKSDMAALIPKLLAMREELHPGRPLAIGALAGPLHVGDPSWELPRGTASGEPEKLAESLRDWVAMGVSHIQLRFPARSVEELCDQMAAFSSDVAPLVQN
ncbi:MAG: LLM class F420-dependent oxidoreductase, partial [Gemmatimonadales bacterium]